MADSPGTISIPTRAGRMLGRLGLSLIGDGDELIDWYEVAGTAMDVAGEDWLDARVDESAADEFAGHILEAAPHVADFTGLELKAPLPAAAVFNKSEWIATTAANLKPLLETALRSVYKEQPNRVFRAATSAEAGLLLGYLAGRVLGQYDLPIMRPAGAPTAFYFILPNIIQAESRLGLEPGHFRRWVVLHEVTHGYQFEANPWLKRYLTELVEENTAYMEARLGRAGSGSGLLFTKSMRQVMSPDENPALAKAQALMSILEGYSEYVMEEAGARIIEGGRGIAGLLDEARRTRNWGQKLLERLIGLEMKVEQYRAGYQFIKQAADVGGISLVNMVWQGPREMPTLTELRRPDLWMTRMLRTE